MGDAGSLTLGYVISFLIIHQCVSNQVSPELPNPYMVIAFATVLVPLLDVIRVVLHRLRNHRNRSCPIRINFHHKLLRTGMRVRMVMVTILCVSAFFHRIECLIGHEGKRHLPLALELGFMVYPSLDDQPLHYEAS